MQLFDTHCHIHEADSTYDADTESRQKWLKAGVADADQLISVANQAGVSHMVCVGTTLPDSVHAVSFVAQRQGVWASIGIHPHEAKDYVGQQPKLDEFAALATQSKVVAVGECGLDYYYNHSSRADQIAILEFQLDVAGRNGLPVIFHVRDAFDDLWPILANFSSIRGVIHSFTSDTHTMSKIVSNGLYVGLNGIMTFTKNPDQLAAAKAVPNDKLLLETDAPFLTPAPYRGTICTPSHVATTAAFLAGIRNQSLSDLAEITTANAKKLFGLE